jgi:hypothetical protein
MKTISILILFLALGCVHNNSPSVYEKKTNYTLIYNQYGNTHFFGVGSGSGATEQLAIKIAKAKALGELASNVKVTVMSRLELSAVSEESETSFSMNETLKQQVISIGNATVRSPEYEILDLSGENGSFTAEVLAKKNKKEHFLTAARNLELDGSEELFNMIMNKVD